LQESGTTKPVKIVPTVLTLTRQRVSGVGRPLELQSQHDLTELPILLERRTLARAPNLKLSTSEGVC